jgi:hypothetical protein
MPSTIVITGERHIDIDLYDRGIVFVFPARTIGFGVYSMLLELFTL